MFVRILGLIDIFAALCLLAVNSTFSNTFFVILGVILLLKGVPFALSGDFGSFIDIFVAGLFFVSILFTIPMWLLVVSMIVLGQKGLFSLF